MKLFFNAKFDFNSTWNRDSTTSHHKHPVCQSPAGEAEKLTNVWSRYFGTNRIIDNWHRCLGVMWRKRKNYFKKNLWTLNFDFIDPQNYLHIMRTFLNHIKNETLDEIKTSLENLWQRMIHLSEFFQYSFELILKRKCLVGASRVRSGESGTPSTIIYTRWSSRHYELGCDAPVALSKLRLYLANHRAGYFSNLACDWLSIVWAYSEQETENGHWSSVTTISTGCLFS